MACNDKRKKLKTYLLQSAKNLSNSGELPKMLQYIDYDPHVCYNALALLEQLYGRQPFSGYRRDGGRPADDDTSILHDAPPRRTDVNSEDLLEWVSRNTLRAIEEALPIWARQGAVFATFEGQPESARKHSVKRRRQTRRQGGSSMSPHSKSHLTAFFFPTLPKGELHPYVPANLRDDKGP
jgi:hypothetical protein